MIGASVQLNACAEPLVKARIEPTRSSDGNILEIMPDLIELGVDVLNCQAVKELVLICF